MEYLPIFLDLKGRLALVIGGGDIAARKVSLLLKAGARVRVVAPVLGPELARERDQGALDHIQSDFTPDRLDGAALAIAATDDRAVNRRVSHHARLRGLPINVVDDPSLCSFIMPAIIDRAPVTVAVSTGGASPVLARWVRARIEASLPPALGRLAALARRYRNIVRGKLTDLDTRRRFWETLFAGRVPDLVFAHREAEAEAALVGQLDSSAPVPDGQVFLVGAGPGDPDLLTVRALRLLQSAEVIVHDRLVSDEVLDLARRDATRIYVGKQSGNHAMAQDDINALLVRLALDGKQVVRLKGGDPFVFGRGGEEAEALARAGVTCHIVPGITAATGCAAYAGIPLTHRDAAQQCVFVTGHGKDGAAPDLNWDSLARPNQTVVIYMGLRTLGAVAAKLADHGMPASTPAAIVENGTTPEERVVVGTVADLESRATAAGIEGPAVIIVGEVVSLRQVRADASPQLALAG